MAGLSESLGNSGAAARILVFIYKDVNDVIFGNYIATYAASSHTL